MAWKWWVAVRSCSETEVERPLAFDRQRGLWQSPRTIWREKAICLRSYYNLTALWEIVTDKGEDGDRRDALSYGAEAACRACAVTVFVALFTHSTVPLAVGFGTVGKLSQPITALLPLFSER